MVGLFPVALHDVGGGLQWLRTAGALGRVGLLPFYKRRCNATLFGVEFNNPPAHAERSLVHCRGDSCPGDVGGIVGRNGAFLYPLRPDSDLAAVVVEC